MNPFIFRFLIKNSLNRNTLRNSSSVCFNGNIFSSEIVNCNLSTRSKYEQRKCKSRDNLAVGFSLTFLASMGWLSWRNKELLKSLFPIVEAAQPLDTSMGGSRRNRFNFIADVVESTAKSVVYIEISDRRGFFGGAMTQSNGSGFVVKSDGLILTNAHVVMARPNSVVNVKFHDGSVLPGTVEDVDMRLDLATVRVKANKPLPELKLGNSHDIRPGEWVVAVGSPLSLSNTVTAGVVSTVQRTSQELKLYGKNMEYIQTDASITFGNSGGPLINLDGEAIGINSMKVTAGISFAIPIDYAKEFLGQPKDRRPGQRMAGEVNPKRFMGITMLSLTPSIIRELQSRNHNIPSDVTHGVLVWKVIVNSPAHKGGLRPGDIVTEINDEPVLGAATVYKLLEDNQTLKMNVIRDGVRKVLVVVPEAVY